jgi:hypothetical protein
MFKKDDEDWLDILAGKNVPNANPTTVRDAHVLREALQAEKRLQKILARLDIDEYLKPETSPALMEPTEFQPSQGFFPTLATQIGNLFRIPRAPVVIPYLAVAVLLMTVLGFIIPQILPTGTQDASQPDKQTPHLIQKSPESSSDTPQLKLSDENPQEMAEDLKEEFMSAGAKVQISQLGETFRVDIKIPETPSDDLRELCGDYGINDLTQVMSSTRVVRFIVSPEPQN